MQQTQGRRILIVEDIESTAFEKAILILKENVVREEEIVINEAREVVLKYMQKYEKGSRGIQKKKRRVLSHLLATGSGALMGGVLSCLLLWT